MNEFSFGRAWTKGFGFFAGQGANHAVALIGVGLIAPFVLQYLLLGSAMGMINPATTAQQVRLGGLSPMDGVTILVAMIVTYVLQMGSYFASWRLGLGEGETLAGVIGYGLVAGLMVIVGFALVGILGLVVLQAAAVAGVILLLIATLPLFAMFYTAIAGAVAVGMLVLVLFMLALGSGAANDVPLAGGGGLAIAILLAATALLFWLTARFSCVTPVMADRRTLNLLEGIAESWRLTSADQWRIMLYLGILGVALLVVLVIVAVIVGVGMASAMRVESGVPQMGLGATIAGTIIGIPFAYVAVLVPAGIYRELVGETSPAQVFV